MELIRERPLLTDVYEQLMAFVPESSSAYVFGVSNEERSAHSEDWERQAINVKFVRVVDERESGIVVQAPLGETTVSLRSESQIRALLSGLNSNALYIDITGLAHHVWAPLLRVALMMALRTKVVYVEPGDYRFSRRPTEAEIFDLSERISGIAPIPGFFGLSDPEDDAICFVPLLGFEGPRLAYLLEYVQPPRAKIVPVVGVPGFRVEYPFYTYHGNQQPLRDTNAWKNIRFARANCPFSLFYLLQDISRDYPEHLIKIAPIGTKPHALGAVLYSLAGGRRVELVYDHPIRKADRTMGSARTLVYHVSFIPLTTAS